ncbi:MAG: DNA topology modulation protein [Acidobacteriota bacterium]|nr:DNA topology modulation protein [Acidobacteriota bacterium]
MKRILVIGSSGAGKSTFSRRLGKIVGIEVVHLDKLHWKPNWTEPSKDEWQKILAEAVKKDSWIMDGNYSRTIEMRVAACDTVIFLDMPRVVCIYRILQRVAFYYGKHRPDMAEGCNEQFDWKFLVWVWNYPNRSKPIVEKILKEYEGEKTVVRLSSKRAAENFLINL